MLLEGIQVKRRWFPLLVAYDNHLCLLIGQIPSPPSSPLGLRCSSVIANFSKHLWGLQCSFWESLGSPSTLRYYDHSDCGLREGQLWGVSAGVNSDN